MSHGRSAFLNISLNEEDGPSDYDVRRPQWLKQLAQDFDILDEVDFVVRYHLSKSTVLSVLDKIEQG